MRAWALLTCSTSKLLVSTVSDRMGLLSYRGFLEICVASGCLVRIFRYIQKLPHVFQSSETWWGDICLPSCSRNGAISLLLGRGLLEQTLEYFGCSPVPDVSNSVASNPSDNAVLQLREAPECLLEAKWHMGVSQNYGYLFGGSHNKDYSILGSILGSPYFGNLPYAALEGRLISARNTPSN